MNTPIERHINYVWALSMVLFLPGSCFAQLSPEVISNIDNIFQESDNKSPGYMVAVIQKDQFLFEKGYGLAQLEHQIPIDRETNFNIASLSKQFTAAAIALLILDDQIQLDDFVSDYLIDFPFARDSVRIEHLIYMTSGINDYYYNPREHQLDWSTLQFFNIDDAINASYSSQELMYQPGTQWSYSNINYMLLTKIVEKVSNLSFSFFLKKTLFEPLGMNSTSVNSDIFEVIPNRALGYNFRTDQETSWMIKNGYLPAKGEGFLQIHRNSSHYGGSGIYTSMEDYKKWISNFYTKKFGGAPFYNLMHQTATFSHKKDNDAFGLVIDQHDGKDIVWYEGGDWGFSSYMMRFPESETTIVCFSNLGSGNARNKTRSIYDVLIEFGIME